MATQWFQTVFGFQEQGFRQTQAQFTMADGPEGDNTLLKCKANGREYFVGPFSVSSVAELKDRVVTSKNAYEKKKSNPDATAPAAPSQRAESGATATKEQRLSSSLSLGCTFKHIAGIDIRNVHRDPACAGSVIMVASQLNCLEMVGPGVSPERGIAGYANDPTQGPACALSCPAGTVYRNYFAPTGKGQAGGNDSQINCAADIEKLVDNNKHKYWHLSNGYLQPNTTTAMHQLAVRIGPHASELGRAIVDALRVGVHWSTEVETASKHRVAQVFASAVPVGYNKSTKSADWASFATLVLEGAFTATLFVAGCLAYERGTRVKVFLCPVGGGAFENRKAWIAYAMTKALYCCRDLPIDVMLAHHATVVESHFKAVGVPTADPWFKAVEMVEAA